MVRTVKGKVWQLFVAPVMKSTGSNDDFFASGSGSFFTSTSSSNSPSSCRLRLKITTNDVIATGADGNNTAPLAFPASEVVFRFGGGRKWKEVGGSDVLLSNLAHFPLDLLEGHFFGGQELGRDAGRRQGERFL